MTDGVLLKEIQRVGCSSISQSKAGERGVWRPGCEQLLCQLWQSAPCHRATV